ncbi:MAG: hypothetical protein CK425_10710 [Parachlamydia sp.]|nr:MAG: hypothetical protein CK425_10710 [Parachlamydia sp.]
MLVLLILFLEVFLDLLDVGITDLLTPLLCLSLNLIYLLANIDLFAGVSLDFTLYLEHVADELISFSLVNTFLYFLKYLFNLDPEVNCADIDVDSNCH